MLGLHIISPEISIRIYIISAEFDIIYGQISRQAESVMKEKDKKKSTGSEDRSRSPEKLNEYIRIGNAGIYILIAALILVVAALIVWGFVGRIPQTTSEYGVITGGEYEGYFCVCFIGVEENTGLLPRGTDVTLRMGDGRTIDGEIVGMTSVPQSSDEIKELLGADGIGFTNEWAIDYLVGDSVFSYTVTIMTEEDLSVYYNQIVGVTIITDEVKPISFLLK